MKNVDSKLLLGLIVGAAVGAAVGYLAATDKKEQLVEELNNVLGKVKEGVNTAYNKYKESGMEMLKAAREGKEEVVNKAEETNS
ncbi:MAG: YtxH domain-containing protein [Tannerellaceae bacterium]|nr:YtxH domain-containing protein [Tannerellaceae bacterium]